jgi:hypothetical protein
MTEPTQSERVLAFLRAHPGATALDIAHGCHPWVSNPRARISDLRAAGHVVDMVRRTDGKNGFVVREPRPVTSGETVPMFGREVA